MNERWMAEDEVRQTREATNAFMRLSRGVPASPAAGETDQRTTDYLTADKLREMLKDAPVPADVVDKLAEAARTAMTERDRALRERDEWKERAILDAAEADARLTKAERERDEAVREANDTAEMLNRVAGERDEAREAQHEREVRALAEWWYARDREPVQLPAPFARIGEVAQKHYLDMAREALRAAGSEEENRNG